MLHTWQVSSSSTEQSQTSGTQHNNPALHQHRRRPSKTSRIKACETCRRRKIRCDGQQPCEACVYYSRSGTCRYGGSVATTAGRGVTASLLSQRSLPHEESATSGKLQDYKELFRRLFPRHNDNPNHLLALSRDELVELIEAEDHIPPSQNERYSSHVSAASATDVTADASYSAVGILSDTATQSNHLEQLQPVPDGIPSATQSTSPSDIRGLTDEVNALSLSVQTSTSFLGISSVAAALRVIFWLNSDVQQLCTKALEGGQSEGHSHVQNGGNHIDPNTETQSRQEDSSMSASDSRLTFSLWEEVPLLRAYFTYVHPFAPMLEEANFRKTYMEGKRSDPRWLLLLNTVLALGSVADASSDHPHDHRHYWQKASQYLTIQCLNSTHIETIQALSLIGGLYLHYINEPRLANSIMGAASRLATSLGLHRELGVQESARTSQYNAWIDVRRRTWWTLFTLDAWAGYGLSRPGMRRLNEAISTQLPTHLPGDPSNHLLALFKQSVDFCYISTELEDSLARCPFLSRDRREILDGKVSAWFRTTTSAQSTPTPSASSAINLNASESHGFLVLRNVMRWRYMNCRIIIHRPILLHVAVSALDATQMGFSEKRSVEICCTTAIDLIHDISTTWQCQWKPSQMAGWNATWLLYQALMVPLILLFTKAADFTMQEACRGAVETGLVTLESLLRWSNTAERSLEVVKQIYSVSQVETNSRSPNIAHQSSNIPSNLDEYSQNAFPQDYGVLHQVLRPTLQDQPLNDIFEALDWYPCWDETGAAGLYGYGLYDEQDARTTNQQPQQPYSPTSP